MSKWKLTFLFIRIYFFILFTLYNGWTSVTHQLIFSFNIDFNSMQQDAWCLSLRMNLKCQSVFKVFNVFFNTRNKDQKWSLKALPMQWKTPNSFLHWQVLHYLVLISSVKIDDLGVCLKASYLTLINLTTLMIDSIVLANANVFQSLLPKYIVSHIVWFEF